MPRKQKAETALHKPALGWCALNGFRAWRTNTGRRGGISFGFKGQPDISGFSKHGTAVFIECKRLGERLTVEQHAFLVDAVSCDCIALVWTENGGVDIVDLPENMKPKGTK